MLNYSMFLSNSQFPIFLQQLECQWSGNLTRNKGEKTILSRHIAGWKDACCTPTNHQCPCWVWIKLYSANYISNVQFAYHLHNFLKWSELIKKMSTGSFSSTYIILTLPIKLQQIICLVPRCLDTMWEGAVKGLMGSACVGMRQCTVQYLHLLFGSLLL